MAALLVLALLAVATLTGSVRVAWADGVANIDLAAFEEGSAADDAAGFGITGFARYMRGAARPVGDEDLGYRFPLPEGANIVVVNTADGVFVHVDEAAAAAAGFAADDAGDVAALQALICALDEQASKGGALLADTQGGGWTVSTGERVPLGPYEIRFAVEVDGRSYCSIVPAGLAPDAAPTPAAEAAGLDLGDAVLWCDGACLVRADEVARVAEPGPWDMLATFLTGIDYRPFWVSIKTSAVALVITFALGLFAAWRTMGASSRLKGLLDSVFTIPMVLPPTVCGFLLLLLFGQSTPVGRWFIAHGLSLVFSWPAAVISAIVVSFPLMYRTALGAFESLDAQMLDAARTLGWSEVRIFRTLMLPLAWPSIAAGTVLAFARAMGEFGCTLFFAGNYAGVTQTIPIAIYFEWMSGNIDVALFWVLVVIVFSFLVVLAINIYTARSQRYRIRGGAPRRRRDRRSEPVQDDVNDVGGDALRIDREALRALVGSPAEEGER